MTLNRAMALADGILTTSCCVAVHADMTALHVQRQSASADKMEHTSASRHTAQAAASSPCSMAVAMRVVRMRLSVSEMCGGTSRSTSGILRAQHTKQSVSYTPSGSASN